VQSVQVENVVPRQRDARDEDVSHVLAVESVDEVRDGVGDVRATDRATAEREPVDDPTRPDHHAGERAGVAAVRLRDAERADA